MEGGAFESTPEAKEYRLLIHREVEGCEKKDGFTRVYIHPSSINFSEREYPFPIMLYVCNSFSSMIPYDRIIFNQEFHPFSISTFNPLINIDNCHEYIEAFCP